VDKLPSLTGLQLTSQTLPVPEHPQSQGLLFLHAETIQLPCTLVTTLRHPPLAGERHACMAGFRRGPRRAALCTRAPRANVVVIVVVIAGLQHVDTIHAILVIILVVIAADAAYRIVIGRATVKVATSSVSIGALVVFVVVAVVPSVADAGSTELGNGAVCLSIPRPLPCLAIQIMQQSGTAQHLLPPAYHRKITVSSLRALSLFRDPREHLMTLTSALASMCYTNIRPS